MWNQQTCKNLFLRQSCADCLEEYRRSLLPDYGTVWDFVILTASSEAQAEVYRAQIDHRLRCGALPTRTQYAVIPDPDGRRVGSGGATLNVLSYIVRQTGREDFRGLRILTIHSGGDSKRVPQYSVLGKLFSPVPRQLPGDRVSTLFDEIIIGMTAIPARLPDGGMLTLSGDVLLLFNPLQLEKVPQRSRCVRAPKLAKITACSAGTPTATSDIFCTKRVWRPSVPSVPRIKTIG